jgi:hypothetical protein
MSDIIVKYNRLNKVARKEVDDFMDFLLSRQKMPKTSFMSTYKSKILNVTVWTASDLEIFDVNQKIFNQWNAPEW